MCWVHPLTPPALTPPLAISTYVAHQDVHLQNATWPTSTGLPAPGITAASDRTPRIPVCRVRGSPRTLTALHRYRFAGSGDHRGL
ncbi:hypothetical protein ACOMHN_026921 [Nucella lapillus]